MLLSGSNFALTSPCSSPPAHLPLRTPETPTAPSSPLHFSPQRPIETPPPKLAPAHFALASTPTLVLFGPPEEASIPPPKPTPTSPQTDVPVPSKQTCAPAPTTSYQENPTQKRPSGSRTLMGLLDTYPYRFAWRLV